MGLHARIQEVSKFLSAKNLSGERITYDPKKAGLALLVVDIQKKYCMSYGHGDKKTEAVAERVAKLVPEFRKARVPVYLIHFSDEGKEQAHQIDFYKIKPKKSDTLVRKQCVSAFAGSNINDILKKDGRKKLLVCGVYLGQCVGQTVRHAIDNEYKVALLEDLSESYEMERHDKKNTLQEMKNNGVLITKSRDVLASFSRMKKSPHKKRFPKTA